MNTLKIVLLGDKLSFIYPAIGAAVMVGLLEWVFTDHYALFGAFFGTIGAVIGVKVGNKLGFDIGMVARRL